LKESQKDGESKFAKASGGDKSNLPMDPAQKKKVNQLQKNKSESLRQQVVKMASPLTQRPSQPTAKKKKATGSN